MTCTHGFLDAHLVRFAEDGDQTHVWLSWDGYTLASAVLPTAEAFSTGTDAFGQPAVYRTHALLDIAQAMATEHFGRRPMMTSTARGWKVEAR
jgi:hypothetical protein